MVLNYARGAEECCPDEGSGVKKPSTKKLMIKKADLRSKKAKGRGWPASWNPFSEHDHYFQRFQLYEGTLTFEEFELEALWLYEIAREADRSFKNITDVIHTVRGNTFHPDRVTFDELFGRERTPILGGDPQPKYFAFFACWPEWPTKPYLSVPIEERLRRLIISPCRISHQPLKEVTKYVAHNVLPQIEFGNGTAYGCIALQIDWESSDAEIQKSFANLLLRNRPLCYPNPASLGSKEGHKVGMRADLTAITATRLRDFHGTMESVRDNVPKTHLASSFYGDDNPFRDARERCKFTVWSIVDLIRKPWERLPKKRVFKN